MSGHAEKHSFLSRPESTSELHAVSPEPHRILVIDDSPEISGTIGDELEGFSFETIGERASALAYLENQAPQVVILVFGQTSNPQELERDFGTLKDLLQEAPDTKIIIITSSNNRQNAIRAIDFGAYDFHETPIETDVLALTIRRAFELSNLEADTHRLQRQVSGSFDGMMTDSPKVHNLFRTVEKIANTNTNVLVCGDHGTRKEMFAQAIHSASPRAPHQFVPIYCGAISGELLEAELFGHEEGAFHGAIRQVKGKIEIADRGTLFLDDIDQLTPGLQTKLLKVIEDKTVMRIGGDEKIPVDVRIICASHSSTKKLLRKNISRRSLYTHISETILDIPSLKDRDDDCIIMAQYLIDAFANETGMKKMNLSADAIAAIQNYAWPGNIRELENKIKRAMVLADGGLITSADLQLRKGQEPNKHLTLRDAREAAERKVIRDAMGLANGNLSQTAKLLEVSRPTVYNLIKSLGIKVD